MVVIHYHRFHHVLTGLMTKLTYEGIGL